MEKLQATMWFDEWQDEVSGPGWGQGAHPSLFFFFNVYFIF